MAEKKNENKEENKHTIEQGLHDIEELVEKLREPDTSLEESFKLYEEGLNKVKAVNAEIDRIEKKMKVLSEEN
ncbi:MAG: exodeoxyribonuclease VII small subunit [Lachnospiraceae bacterium]|nr:exodeoxyribonuclease VII small subunit [Lachnospiraceae bacterium]